MKCNKYFAENVGTQLSSCSGYQRKEKYFEMLVTQAHLIIALAVETQQEVKNLNNHGGAQIIQIFEAILQNAAEFED